MSRPLFTIFCFHRYQKLVTDWAIPSEHQRSEVSDAGGLKKKLEFIADKKKILGEFFSSSGPLPLIKEEVDSKKPLK